MESLVIGPGRTELGELDGGQSCSRRSGKPLLAIG